MTGRGRRLSRHSKNFYKTVNELKNHGVICYYRRS